MRLFEPGAKHRSEGTRRLFAAYEILYTCVDFGAALAFVIGSVMFFSEAWLTAGTWLFLIGSILFAVKPTIRLVREVHLYREGRAEDVAARLRGETSPGRPRGEESAPPRDGDSAPLRGGDSAPHRDGDSAPHRDGDSAPLRGGDSAPHRGGDSRALRGET